MDSTRVNYSSSNVTRGTTQHGHARGPAGAAMIAEKIQNSGLENADSVGFALLHKPNGGRGLLCKHT